MKRNPRKILKSRATHRQEIGKEKVFQFQPVTSECMTVETAFVFPQVLSTE